LSQYDENGSLVNRLRWMREARFDGLHSQRDDEDAKAAAKGRDEWRSREPLEMVRSLPPGVVVNDRLDLDGNVVTPEQCALDVGNEAELLS
jgi:alpha-L-fucosidase